MCLTYSLQFFVPIQIMLPFVSKTLEAYCRPSIIELLFRTLMVLITRKWSHILSVNAEISDIQFSFFSLHSNYGASSECFYFIDWSAMLDSVGFVFSGIYSNCTVLWDARWSWRIFVGEKWIYYAVCNIWTNNGHIRKRIRIDHHIQE